MNVNYKYESISSQVSERVIQQGCLTSAGSSFDI